MNWTTASDIAAAAAKLWDSGRLPAAVISGEAIFPFTVKLKGPGTGEMAEKLTQTRAWCASLRAGSKEERGNGYTLEYRHIRHKILGENDIPDKAVITAEEDALALAGKKREAARLRKIAEETAERLPALLIWLYKKPLRALDAAAQWTLILDVCEWMLAHPRPAIYIREMDIPGVHTKFIETRKAMLGELFDLLLPESAVDKRYTAGADFAKRYGFRAKAEPVRLRLPLYCRLFPESVTDITLASDELAATPIPCREIVITENEISFLSMPRAAGRLLMWGHGYGFEMLKKAAWLADKKIFYWGDIDTHGFAILSELRANCPHARSLLMDESTLAAYRAMCVEEPQPAKYLPERLTPEEARLFKNLHTPNGKNLRLEQERIGIGAVRKAIETACGGE